MTTPSGTKNRAPRPSRRAPGRRKGSGASDGAAAGDPTLNDAAARPSAAASEDDENEEALADEPMDLAEAGAEGSGGGPDGVGGLSAEAADPVEGPDVRGVKGGLEPVPAGVGAGAETPTFVSPGIRDPLARFMAEIRRYPRLSEEEERRLGRSVRERGDMDAARRLVVHNLRLVVAIANQYRRAWANILDLFQEGSVGLMEAVKRWEPSLGPRFGSYAAYWIRAYLLKFLMTNSRLIHVGNTRAGRKLFFRLERECCPRG